MLVKFVKVEDVMKKFRVSKNTAINFMKNKELCSFYMGAPLYCSKEKFDEYINLLNDIGWKSYGAQKRTKRSTLLNTLEPVIKAKDIMFTFDVCKGSALKILDSKYLCSYKPTRNMYVCERQYFLEYLHLLEGCGGVKGFRFITNESYTGRSNDALSFLQAVCTDDEFERLMKNGVRRINYQQK